MKVAYLVLALTGCFGSEHELRGTYRTNYDGGGGAPCGDAPGRLCVEVTACDASGILDHGYFFDPTIEGDFAVHVPDGATDVHLVWDQHTFDAHDHVVERVIRGPIHDDLELGLVVVSQWPTSEVVPSNRLARSTGTGSHPPPRCGDAGTE